MKAQATLAVIILATLLIVVPSMGADQPKPPETVALTVSITDVGFLAHEAPAIILRALGCQEDGIVAKTNLIMASYISTIGQVIAAAGPSLVAAGQSSYSYYGSQQQQNQNSGLVIWAVGVLAQLTVYYMETNTRTQASIEAVAVAKGERSCH